MSDINVTIGDTGSIDLTLGDEGDINLVLDGISTIVTLSDTPTTYASQAGKFVKVNSTEDGVEFSSNVKGNFEYLADLLKQADDLIGKSAAIKYFSLTPDGVPRFPYVIAIRDYE